MTIHEMNAFISHFEKDFRTEIVHCQYDFMYHLEAMLDVIVRLGCCYFQLENFTDARYTLNFAVKLIDLVCENEDVKPTLHCRELGDIYALLAKVYLKEGKMDEALNSLKMMVNHDVIERAEYKQGMKMQSPLLCDTENCYFAICPNIKQKLIDKLGDTAFDDISNSDEFLKMIQAVKTG